MAGEKEAVKEILAARKRPVSGVAALGLTKAATTLRVDPEADAADERAAQRNWWTRYDRRTRGAAASDELRKRATTPTAAGTVDAAQANVERLRDLAKSNTGWANSRQLVEAERLAEALAAPVPRADLLTGQNPTPAEPHSESPQLTAATAGTAATMGGNPDEYIAAVKARDEHWLGRLHDRDVLAAVKAARTNPTRCGTSGPPRFKA